MKVNRATREEVGGATVPAEARRPRGRPLFLLAAAAWLALILAATLMPREGTTHPESLTPVLCLVCGETGAVDVLYNLILFLPLGFALRMAGFRSGRIVLLCFCLTFAVESAQYWIIPGRDASLSDVLTNTTGGAAGVLLANVLPIVLDPEGSALAILLGLSTLIPAGVLGLSAWLLRGAPPHSLWYGQWAPELGQYDRFQGRILSATLGGDPLPIGPLRQLPTRDPGPVRIPFTLSATFVTGVPPADLAPVVSVFDEHEQKVLLLGQRQDRLEFEARIRGEDYRFRPLRLSLPRAAPLRAGDTLRAEGRFDNRFFGLDVFGKEGDRSRALAISPAFGWVLITPITWPLGEEVRVATALWLALLWIPLGFYQGRWMHRSGRSGSAALAVTVGAGLGAALIVAALTRAAGLAPNHWSELAGTAVGTWIGFLAAASRIVARIAGRV